MQYMICSKVAGETTFNYRGMDRNGLIWKDVCDDEQIVDNVEAICHLARIEDENDVIELYKNIIEAGYNDFELIAVDEVRNKNCWTLLGYDIGEKSDLDRKWSAIFKYNHYTNYDNAEHYFKKLNNNGLFSNISDAEDFRSFYLNKSGDEVLSYASVEENVELYQVASVYLYTC